MKQIKYKDDQEQFSWIYQIAKANPSQEKIIRCTNRVYLPIELRETFFSEKTDTFYKPPLLEIQSLVSTDKIVYVGFEGFIDSDTIIVPPWILRFIGEEGEHVKITLIKSLPYCVYFKITPVQTEFFDEMTNPQFCLLNALHRKYNAITQGQIIELEFGGQTCEVLINECRPVNSVYMLECDPYCDFVGINYVDKYTPLLIGQPTEEIFVETGKYHYLKLRVANDVWVSIIVIDSKGDTALFASRKDKFPKLNRFYWSSIQYETAWSGDLYGPKPVLIPSVQMVERENQLRIQSGLDFRGFGCEMKLQMKSQSQLMKEKEIGSKSLLSNDSSLLIKDKDDSKQLIEKNVELKQQDQFKDYLQQQIKTYEFFEEIYIGILGIGENNRFAVRADEIKQDEYEKQLKKMQEGHRLCYIKQNEDDEDDNDDEEDDDDEEEEEDDEEDEEEDDDEYIISYITPKKKPNPQASLLSPQVKVSYKRCSNCHDRIPEKEIVIHERHCKLTIKLCPECNFKVASGFLKKHTLLIHSNVVCACGLQISSVRNIPMHLSTSCPASEEICPVCSIRVKRSEQSRHRLMCDSQQYSCSSCGKRIAGAKMLMHLQVEHQNKMC
ncbi:MAG: hypothetical protein EZS28_012954 [Streblomastix strix]|uniref:Ubiquitin fusion degradation protein UFD1 N-terminal subdomain 2 domain-containing protein n=1 Tax=Streblomastix strix TaxID=222440 RepID=A0A5J4W9A5_9EUKA|nr:MAG: hypothetical protein EZS28_012954 [Streblomastix strix]